MMKAGLPATDVQAPGGIYGTYQRRREPAVEAQGRVVKPGQVVFLPDEPIVRRQGRDPAPLTVTQRHWWDHLETHQSGHGERLVQFAVRIRGPLDVDRLRHCLNLVIRRHESLRTRFLGDDRIVVQQPALEADGSFRFVDLSARSTAEAEMAARELAIEFAWLKISLRSGPLLGTLLMQLTPSDHVFVLAAEHIISDLASNSILHREIWKLYETADDTSLGEPPRQYADFAVWQQTILPTWVATRKSSWLRKFDGAPSSKIAVAESSTPNALRRYRLRELEFGRTLTDQLCNVATLIHTKLAFVVLAAHASVMSRWCQQQDVLLIFASGGRFRPEQKGMVGFLANSLHMRVRIDPHDAFCDVVLRIAAEHREAVASPDFDTLFDLLPNLQTDIYCNWIPMWMQPQNTRVQCGSTSLDIERFGGDLPWSRRFFPMFYETPSGIVLSVSHEEYKSLSEALDVWQTDLFHFMGEIVSDPHIPVATPRMALA